MSQLGRGQRIDHIAFGFSDFEGFGHIRVIFRGAFEGVSHFQIIKNLLHVRRQRIPGLFIHGNHHGRGREIGIDGIFDNIVEPVTHHGGKGRDDPIDNAFLEGSVDLCNGKRDGTSAQSFDHGRLNGT